MEFAVCPACKQSVLDDDAVECPFCGSSMKDKPGLAKPVTPMKPATAAPSRTAAGKPLGKPKPDDVSAFDFADQLAVKATQASIQKTKSKTLQVKCPMCETVGYIPPDAAGQAIKCANSQCMVPVFTAPKLEPVKVIEPPPPKPKRNLLMVGGVTTAIMAIGGVIAWMIAGVPEKTDLNGPTDADRELVRELYQQQKQVSSAPAEKGIVKDSQSTGLVTTETKARESSHVSLPDWLKLMSDTSLQPRQNRSKPYCRRLTAEAFALADDLAGAKNQLDALSKVGADVPYYKVVPLAEIAWKQLSAGDRTGAVKSIDESFTAALKMPKTGRDRLQSIIVLAAALIAVERDDDAQQLIAAHASKNDLAQLAQRQRSVLTSGTYNLAELEKIRPVLPWQFPLTVGVAFELAGRNQGAAATRWIDSLKLPVEQAEATAASLAATVWRHSLHGEALDTDSLVTQAEALPAPGNLLAISRLGLAFSAFGNRSAAETCLQKAIDLSSTVPMATEIILPDDLRELAEFNSPDALAGQFVVSALAEAASERQRARLARVRAWCDRWGKRPHHLLGASALVGLPPFSLLATAAGVLAIRTRAFCAIVLAGRGARFAIVAAVTLVAR